MPGPLAFRNVARYVRSVKASVPLYEALGFRPVRAMDGFAILEIEGGPRVVLHESEEVSASPGATALGFTMLDVAAARAHVEGAGWRLLRAPEASDRGFFFVYVDPDGNPINLVGERR